MVGFTGKWQPASAMVAKDMEVTTIVINLPYMSFIQRLKFLPFLLKQSIVQRPALRREFAEWNALKICDTRWHSFLYVLDHYILWGFYCLLAVLKGSARGFRWELPYRSCKIEGIHITL